jgi:penicillin-binding protein 2
LRRGLLLIFFIISFGLLFIAKLYHIQVYELEKKSSFLSSATLKRIYDYPERGYVFDRNSKLLVSDVPSYNLMVIPMEIAELDTLEFCNLINISKKSLLHRMKKATVWSPRLPSVFLSYLSKEDYAFLQEKMHKFRGFYIDKKLLRNYPYKSAANVLGYINEVNEETSKRNPYYQPGELIGTTGIEKQYELLLRGTKGVKYMKRNRFNKIIGSFKEGIYDTVSVAGKDLTLSLDTELQQYGELLMKGKRGGIVAIEPESGEILALISMPTYDPNLMVGRSRTIHSKLFFDDLVNKPMYDRSLLAQYAPGSPFKLVQALIGLQEGVITPETGFYCHHGYRYGSGKGAFMRCHCGIVGSPIMLQRGIAKSCNSYFSNVYRRIIEKYPTAPEGMDVWSNHAKSFGLGEFLGYDLPEGQKGMIPDSKLYNKWYPNTRWRSTYTISNAIGQGQILTTPIQLANMTAAIANHGYFYTPHILKKINGVPIKDPTFTKKHYTTINKEHFFPVIEGMHDVFRSGTARFVQVDSLEICGKTGTAENFKRVNGKKVQFEDHSIFIAFAPKVKPKIAIVVYIENGGFGSAIAAPITSLMIEKYINGKVKNIAREERMIGLSLEEDYRKQQLIIDYKIESTEK